MVTDAATAAAIDIVAEETFRYGTGDTAMKFRYVGYRIEQLTPEVTQ